MAQVWRSARAALLLVPQSVPAWPLARVALLPVSQLLLVAQSVPAWPLARGRRLPVPLVCCLAQILQAPFRQLERQVTPQRVAI
jgi:hypothetical protein